MVVVKEKPRVNTQNHLGVGRPKATRPEEAKSILTSSYLFQGRVSLSKEVLSNGF